MNEKELNDNIEKIKQLLTHPDYDKIDAGIELAVSLEEPKIFEILLDGCSIVDGRPQLNEWMKELIILNGELNTRTGYYVFLNLLTNKPDNVKLESSLKLKDITSLDLDRCYLTRLPKSFYKWNNLVSLSLDHNQLTVIPHSIFQLSNLALLFLGDNRIKIVPPEIGTFDNLELLGLGNNIIDDLPKEISNLKNLKDLDISENDFSKSPDIIYELKNLVNLSCFELDMIGTGTNPPNDDFLSDIISNIPNINILQPVECNSCNELRHINNILAPEISDYYCGDCYERWWGDTDASSKSCHICHTDFSPHVSVEDVDSEIPGWVINEQYLNDLYAGWDDGLHRFIIKAKQDIFDITICTMCEANIPKMNIPSTEEAESYAEENGIEYWDN